MLRINQGNEGKNDLIGHEKSTSGFRKKITLYNKDMGFFIKKISTQKSDGLLLGYELLLGHGLL